MAEVEERANADQAKVHDWLARAAVAPADRSWSLHRLRRPSRDLALGLRELRRLRHAAVARARHLWPDPAARNMQAELRGTAALPSTTGA